jgi:hypothetical protein
MNGEFPQRTASALASDLAVSTAAPEGSVDQAFQRIYSRPASPDEMERALSFLSTLADKYATEGASSAEARTKAFEQFAKALFASNEFMFVE